MRLDLYHNIRWSRYKATVFSALHTLSQSAGVNLRITQIADTSSERLSLSDVDLSYHNYPHTLLFAGSYQSIPKWKLMSTLFNRVWHSDADLILLPGFSSPEHWLMLLAAVLRRKKRATFCDSTLLDRPQSKVKGLLKRFFFSACQGVFCYGQRARQYLLHYGVPESRIHLRCQAAALPADYSPAKALEDRLQCSPPTQAPRFVYVGRLSPEKGLDALIAAFAGFRLASPQARLVIIGGGPLRQSLEQQALDLGLGDAVDFAGSMGQEALAEQYLKATCLVLPSRSEPWGLVVNEALHYGCPVVVSDHCGCVPELVIDGITGYRFETGNPDDLRVKLKKVVDELGDVKVTAERCLDLISHYRPDAAAQQMLEGCKKVLSA
jgi:glycosyltransferase involved in cell wall biosynthesis